MADSQQPKQPAKKAASPRQKAPSNRQVLEGAFSPAVVDAIDGRIKEVSLETLAEVKQQLVDMIEEHKKTIAAVRAMPESPEREVAKQAVDETTGQLSASADELNQVIEDTKAGQPVESEKADQVAESVAKTGEAVKETSEEVGRQLTALKEQSDRHEAILAVNHDGERPPSRIDSVEERLDRVELCLDEHQGVIAYAFAQARAAVTGGAAWRRAAAVGLTTFVVTFLLYCLLVLISPIVWEWDNALGVPAIFAGIAAAIMFLRHSSNEVEAVSYADAAAIVAADRRRREEPPVRNQRAAEGDAGTSILPGGHDDHGHDRRTGASAAAAASASAR